MGGPPPASGSTGPSTGGFDQTKLRLAVMGVIVFALFVGLFSRLWFLQVLAADEYQTLAEENRVRFVFSEPPRGRILDRNEVPLVENRSTSAVTVDREVLAESDEPEKVLRRLSRLLRVKLPELERRLDNPAASPYKPVAVAYDVREAHVMTIRENPEDFPGVKFDLIPIRHYPLGATAANILGYVGEISPEDLESDHFRRADPPYQAGDLVGKTGLEYVYDRYLRGRPRIDKVVVNSTGEVVGSRLVQEEEPGQDLITSIDAEIQRTTEKALRAGIKAARGAGFMAPAGGVAVMDPTDGAVVAMASYPTFDPTTLADGISQKEFDSLGAKTPNNPDDDALLNRAIQAQRQPGSTFKVVTAGAAMATGVASATTTLPCPPSRIYPPEGGPGSVVFRNWTSADMGSMGFPKSLEVSCDTFYYELGWDMQERFGVTGLEDPSPDDERFQRYTRTAGFGDATGVDLPFESSGRVPDQRWCSEYRKATDGAGCADGWLPGYTVNMSIGQGDLIVSPLQMANTYAAIANGGRVMQPRLGWSLARPGDVEGEEQPIREFHATTKSRLPLSEAEISVIHQGLIQVVAAPLGTAWDAFAGFPLDRWPLAGKTGTAELGESELNDAWFLSYGPASDPKYVISVYVEKAGHGGESAAPVARQIWEGIFGVDDQTDVQLGQDVSG